MLAPATVERIAAAYGLPEMRPVARMHHSRENVAFELECGAERLVLRQLRARGGLAGLLRQHAFMMDLAARGFPVPAPLLDGEGESIRCIEGTAYAIYPLAGGNLFERGKVLHAAAAGRTLARLHKLAADYPTAIDSQALEFPAQFLEDAHRLQRLAPALKEMCLELGIAAELEYLLARVPGLRSAIGEMAYGELPVVTIHGDYRRANILVDGGEVSAVLDFDRARREARALDVAIAVSSLARGRNKEVFLDLALVRAFMSGYTASLLLDEDELAALPLLIEMRVTEAAIDRASRLELAPIEERAKRARKFRKYVKRLCWLQDEPTWRQAVQGS